MTSLNHLQKNMAQLITWPFLMIQSVSFTSATFETFAEAYLCFFSIWNWKKNFCVLISNFFGSLISVSKKWNIETMLGPFPIHTIDKSFNNKLNEKRSQDYQSMDPEYVTGQINSPILELLFKRFCYLIFLPSRKS